MYFQNHNPRNRLTCYDVKLFGSYMPTNEVVAEARWQPEQHHFCITGLDSFPVVPMPLSHFAKLRLNADYYDASPDVVYDVLGDLPISFNGSNEWYAERLLGRGTLRLKHKADGNKLVYGSFQEPIPTMYELVRGMEAVKHSLERRLVAYSCNRLMNYTRSKGRSILKER